MCRADAVRSRRNHASAPSSRSTSSHTHLPSEGPFAESIVSRVGTALGARCHEAITEPGIVDGSSSAVEGAIDNASRILASSEADRMLFALSFENTKRRCMLGSSAALRESSPRRATTSNSRGDETRVDRRAIASRSGAPAKTTVTSVDVSTGATTPTIVAAVDSASAPARSAASIVIRGCARLAESRGPLDVQVTLLGS